MQSVLSTLLWDYIYILKVCFMKININYLFSFQTFNTLTEKPLLVDLTVEEGQRLKVIYGSCKGFHAIDLDTSNVFDIYLPTRVSIK